MARRAACRRGDLHMSEKLTMAQRLARLSGMIVDGRLLRNRWRDTVTEPGRERACLLAALVPENEVKNGDVVASCPAEVMPQWLAILTPSIDDNGTLAAWPVMTRRYAEAARRWSVLDAPAWDRVRHQFLGAL